MLVPQMATFLSVLIVLFRDRPNVPFPHQGMPLYTECNLSASTEGCLARANNSSFDGMVDSRSVSAAP